MCKARVLSEAGRRLTSENSREKSPWPNSRHPPHRDPKKYVTVSEVVVLDAEKAAAAVMMESIFCFRSSGAPISMFPHVDLYSSTVCQFVITNENKCTQTNRP
eukprot:1680701-Prymnesium_polylepis.2